ncbi:MAG: hypothetical protein PHQ04_06790 [Opitutaceae bacterium]|nr:hypothetical protein [Opitutaceae bacterium]
MNKFTATDWDEARKGFRTSIMIDTSLASLAQNLDTKDWPLKGEDEKPSKYIDFTWEELHLLPEFGGNPERIDHLISILQETLAFDAPFGDMVEAADAAVAAESPILKTLRKLGIPVDFPLSLARLSPDVRSFCESQGLATLGQFASFSQDVAQKIVIGGDFRSLLNALIHGDEEGIGRHLPFRRGAQGLHLAEAIGLVLADLPRPELLALAKSRGAKLSSEDAATAKTLSRDELSKMEAGVRSGVDAQLAWFKEQKAALLKLVQEGGSLERYFLVLNDLPREAVAVQLVQAAIKGALASLPPTPKVSAPSGGKIKGFFSRLFGRG